MVIDSPGQQCEHITAAKIVTRLDRQLGNNSGKVNVPRTPMISLKSFCKWGLDNNYTAWNIMLKKRLVHSY